MRHRTTFPGTVDFDNWWIKSKRGTVAQLIKCGRNLHEHNLYSLRYSNGQAGNGTFTTEQLLKSEVVAIRNSEEGLNDATKKTGS